LHHRGIAKDSPPRYRKRGGWSAGAVPRWIRGGGVWNGSRATEHLVRWKAYQGVRISSIWKDLDREGARKQAKAKAMDDGPAAKKAARDAKAWIERTNNMVDTGAFSGLRMLHDLTPNLRRAFGEDAGGLLLEFATASGEWEKRWIADKQKELAKGAALPDPVVKDVTAR
jgi:hypothetical protein